MDKEKRSRRVRRDCWMARKLLTRFVAETRLQEDRPEGRAADPGGGPADREPERPMTISQPQFKPPLAKMRKEEELRREGRGGSSPGGPKMSHGTVLYYRFQKV